MKEDKLDHTELEDPTSKPSEVQASKEEPAIDKLPSQRNDCGYRTRYGRAVKPPERFVIDT